MLIDTQKHKSFVAEQKINEDRRRKWSRKMGGNSRERRWENKDEYLEIRTDLAYILFHLQHNHICITA